MKVMLTGIRKCNVCLKEQIGSSWKRITELEDEYKKITKDAAPRASEIENMKEQFKRGTR